MRKKKGWGGRCSVLFVSGRREKTKKRKTMLFFSLRFLRKGKKILSHRRDEKKAKRGLISAS